MRRCRRLSVHGSHSQIPVAAGGQARVIHRGRLQHTIPPVRSQRPGPGTIPTMTWQEAFYWYFPRIPRTIRRGLEPVVPRPESRGDSPRLETRDDAMIRGVHTMFYSSEPEAMRAFLR